jgi:rhodanese-related sulfurtransferase
MGKGRTHHKPHPGSAPTPPRSSAQSFNPISSPPAKVVPLRRLGLQFSVLLGLSAALGFTFNAANPIGVRFGQTRTASASPSSLAEVAGADTSIMAVAEVQTAPPSLPPPARLTPQTLPQPSLRPALQPTPPSAAQPVPKPPVPQLPAASPTHVHTPVVLPPPTPAAGPAPVIVAPSAQAQLNPAPIHWREAKALLARGGTVLVDVRMKPAYDAGHIPGALSLPESSTPEEYAAFVQAHPADRMLIFYCSSTSCSQSMRVANRFVTEFHYPFVKYMTGGYLEYQQEELARSQPAAIQAQPASP